MEASEKQLIYTVGHSVHSLEYFIEILNSFKIEMLVDIRRFPGSKRYPWFNRENLEIHLRENSIGYAHLEELGGMGKVQPDSINSRWRNEC